jgi:hypothetical protein
MDHLMSKIDSSHEEMNASKEKVKAKIEACLDLMVAYSERTGPN